MHECFKPLVGNPDSDSREQFISTIVQTCWYRVANGNYEIIDDHGFHWQYDSVRVFCVEAEEEMKGDGYRERGYTGDEDNGYYCRSLREATQELVGWYISLPPIHVDISANVRSKK